MKEITDKGIKEVEGRSFIGVLSTMVIFGICLFCGAWALEQIEHEPKKKVIDLPEEIQVVQGGEQLFIESVSNDTISIGFNHGYTIYFENDTLKVETDDKIVYKELVNWKNPSPLQQALITDNE